MTQSRAFVAQPLAVAPRMSVRRVSSWWGAASGVIRQPTLADVSHILVFTLQTVCVAPRAAVELPPLPYAMVSPSHVVDFRGFLPFSP